jgi:hypothetical protein
MNNTMPSFWLFKKHHGHIKILDLNEGAFRDLIAAKKKIKLYNPTSAIDSVFSWEDITPCYSFFFNYQGNGDNIRKLLLKSDLLFHENILIETNASEPIVEVSSEILY